MGRRTNRSRYEYVGHPALDPDFRSISVQWLALSISTRKFDAIAICGMGAAIVAPIIANAVGKPILLVRKKGEIEISVTGVTGRLVEGPRKGVRRYIIIDDVVETGGTVRHIISQIANVAPEAKCVAVFAYDQPEKDGFYINSVDGIPVHH